MSSSSSLAISEVHISGTTLSYVIRAAYCAGENAKYTFDLLGHHSRRHIITDSSDHSAIVETIITGATPEGVDAASADAEKIGYLSISRSPMHKLSWHDTQRLMKKPSGTSSYPHLFMLVTADSSSKTLCGTLKVEYSVFQNVQGTLRAVPLMVDNVVESLVGFTKIEDNYRRNPSILAVSPSQRAALNSKMSEFTLSEPIDQVMKKGAEREKMIEHILALQAQLTKLQASCSTA